MKFTQGDFWQGGTCLVDFNIDGIYQEAKAWKVIHILMRLSIIVQIKYDTKYFDQINKNIISY